MPNTDKIVTNSEHGCRKGASVSTLDLKGTREDRQDGPVALLFAILADFLSVCLVCGLLTVFHRRD
jgi:hypothetical protein